MSNNLVNRSALGYRVENPATGEIIETYSHPTDTEIENALAEAQQGFEEWRKLPIEERAQVVLKAGALFRERAEELAAIITEEMGKGLSEARGEVALCEGIFDYYGTEGPALAAPSPVLVDGSVEARVEKLPVGPLLGIMPWNFPYYQLLRFAIPNLVLGNTLLIKPAETCPRSALVLQKLFEDAGFPSGTYSTLLANHAQIETVIEDPRVKGVSLTGSERAGAAVGVIAARKIKKTVMELGGSDAYIVLDALDVRKAAADAWVTRVSNMGQSCNSNKRIIVHSDIYDEFVSELASIAGDLKPGDPLSEDVGTYNPMATARGAKELAEQVEDAVSKGATLHAGGYVLEGRPAYFAPAVLSGVRPGMRAYEEELFGPVAVVYQAADEAEAVQLANDSEFGLGGAVFSSDKERASRVALQLNTGMTHVNVAAAYGAQLPFGGIGRSGFGRELGPGGMDEFANKRLVVIAE